jgi:hypothetical protein
MSTTQPEKRVQARHEGMVESVTAAESGVDRLKPGAIGLTGVIFIAVTGAAPISAMLFNVPFATGFGTGLYTPAAFLFATIILTIFSIGYVAMARKIRATGGFYTFISHGLGRELGMATGICGALAYSLFEVSLLGGFSYFAVTNFNAWFGWDLPWILFAVGAALLISVLCWFDVELSVKVLGAALIGEIFILAVFDLVVFGAGGSEADGIQWEALNVFQLTDPGVGLAAGDHRAADARHVVGVDRPVTHGLTQRRLRPCDGIAQCADRPRLDPETRIPGGSERLRARILRRRRQGDVLFRDRRLAKVDHRVERERRVIDKHAIAPGPQTAEPEASGG